MSTLRAAAGRCIHDDEIGIGPPVLLAPGFGGYRRGSLAWLVEALAPRFRVVAMANRDAGESEPETEDYRLEDLAGDAAAFLAALRIERAHVLAHAMGSVITLRLALDHPGRIDRLALTSPCVGGEPEHRADEPMPPPAAWWVDDPVDRSRRSLPVVLGPDDLTRMDETDVAAISGPERRNRTTWAGIMWREAATGDAEILGRLADVRAPTFLDPRRWRCLRPTRAGPGTRCRHSRLPPGSAPQRRPPAQGGAPQSDGRRDPCLSGRAGRPRSRGVDPRKRFRRGFPVAAADGSPCGLASVMR